MVPLVNVANCLVYATDGRSVETVLVDGRIVVEHGRVTSFDEADVYHEVERRSPGVIERSGLPLERRWPVIACRRLRVPEPVLRLSEAAGVSGGHAR